MTDDFQYTYLLLFRNQDQVCAATFQEKEVIQEQERKGLGAFIKGLFSSGGRPKRETFPKGFRVQGRYFWTLGENSGEFTDELWTNDDRLGGISFTEIKPDSPLLSSKFVRESSNCRIEKTEDGISLKVELVANVPLKLEEVDSLDGETYVAEDDPEEHVVLVCDENQKPHAFDDHRRVCQPVFTRVP